MKAAPYILKILIGILTITVFVPVIINKHLMFPYITDKNFAFRFLIELAAMLWGTLMVLDKTYRPKFSYLSLVYLYYVLALGLTSALGYEPFKSMWSTMERMEGWITHAHLFVYFIMLGSVFKNAKNWQYYIQTSLVVSFLMLGTGIADKLNGIETIRALIGNQTFVATYAAIHIFMAGVGWFRHAANKYHKIFYAVAALANIVTVILANSRGIFLGLVCAGLAIGVLLLLTSSREKVRKVGIGLIAAVVISGSGILAIHKQVWIKDVPVLKRFYKFTDNPRLRIWKVSLTGLKDRPFLGWGIENFQVVFDKYYDPLLVNDEEWFDRPHNLYLRTLIEGGLVTFAGLIALFGLIFWILLRGDDFPIGFKSVMIGFFVFFLVHNMFNFDTLASLIFINFFIAYVHYVWEKGRGFYFPRPVALGLALVVIPVTSVASMKVHHEERKSLYNFTKVILSAMGRKPRYFHERAKYFFENTYFLRRYGTLVFMLNPQRNLLYNKNVPAADKRRYTKLVLKEMEYILKEIPKTTRIYTLWGFFLNNVGQKERALEAYRVAKKLSPQKIKTIIYMTDVLLKLGKYEEAYQNLKEGFSWFPNYGPLNKHLALTSVLSRKTHDLLKLSPPVLMGALTQPNFQRAFLNTRQVPLYGKLLAEYLKTNPRSLPHLVNLSWAYNMVGQPEIAIKVIDQAVRYHPNYKTKASQIVSAIRQSQKNKAFKRPPKKK